MKELVEDRSSDDASSAPHSTGTRDMGAPATGTRVCGGAQSSAHSNFAPILINLEDHVVSPVYSCPSILVYLIFIAS